MSNTVDDIGDYVSKHICFKSKSPTQQGMGDEGSSKVVIEHNKQAKQTVQKKIKDDEPEVPVLKAVIEEENLIGLTIENNIEYNEPADLISETSIEKNKLVALVSESHVERHNPAPQGFDKILENHIQTILRVERTTEHHEEAAAEDKKKFENNQKAPPIPLRMFERIALLTTNVEMSAKVPPIPLRTFQGTVSLNAKTGKMSEKAPPIPLRMFERIALLTTNVKMSAKVPPTLPRNLEKCNERTAPLDATNTEMRVSHLGKSGCNNDVEDDEKAAYAKGDGDKTDDLLPKPSISISQTLNDIEFFREILQQEEINDKDVITDERDNYLLCCNVSKEDLRNNVNDDNEVQILKKKKSMTKRVLKSFKKYVVRRPVKLMRSMRRMAALKTKRGNGVFKELK